MKSKKFIYYSVFEDILSEKFSKYFSNLIKSSETLGLY